MVRFIPIVLLGLFTASFVHSVSTVQINGRVENREIRFHVQLSLEGPSARIRIPLRARLLNITSPGRASVAYFNDRNVIRVDSLDSEYRGRINLSYSLPIAREEFILDDWLAVPDQKSECRATLSGPAGYRGFFVPYREMGSDGYLLNAEDKPVLVWGIFEQTETVFQGRTYDLITKTRVQTELSNIDAMVRGYEVWLFPLHRDTFHFLELPLLKDQYRWNDRGIFLVLNNTRPDEIRRVLANFYFRGLLGWKTGADAFADLYKRALDDSGSVQKDMSCYSLALSDPVYEKMASAGFDRSSLMSCDMAGVFRNYSLLHLFAWTVGPEAFLENIRNELRVRQAEPDDLAAVLVSGLTNETDGPRTAAVRMTLRDLFPVTRFNPDVLVNGTNVYRNHDSIPDIAVSVDRVRRIIRWDGKRSVSLGTFDARAQADPDRLIPQLNFVNDWVAADVQETAERKAVLQAALEHRKFTQETVRGVIDLRRIHVPESNYYSIPPDTPAYAAVIRFTAPIGGKLTEGVKDLILTVGTNGKAFVIADRARY